MNKRPKGEEAKSDDTIDPTTQWGVEDSEVRKPAMKLMEVCLRTRNQKWSGD